jgi:transposase
MPRRYELTDEEWSKVQNLLPPERTNHKGRPRKDNRVMLNAMIWMARSGAPWRDLPERYGSWKSVYSRFRKWFNDGILDNIFHEFSLDAELSELSVDSTIVRAHQHSASATKLESSKFSGPSKIPAEHAKIGALMRASHQPLNS